MWPFTKKASSLGFTESGHGGLTFQLTPEEQEEVNNIFAEFENYRVHPRIADRFRHGLIARALVCYAEDQTTGIDLSPETARPERISKAIASVSKAYSIVQLPAFAYDLARYLALAGQHEESKRMYRLFLKRQSEAKPDELDTIFQGPRDVTAMVQFAESQVR